MQFLSVDVEEVKRLLRFNPERPFSTKGLGFPNAFQFSHQSKRHGLLAEILLIAPTQAKLALR
jgi:hypothetical protein